MKRIILFTAVLLSAVCVKAQSFSTYRQVPDTGAAQKKWFITKSASISTGFVGFKGGSGTFLAAPVGLQLNRQLTNNLFAFAGVSAAPAIFHFNNTFSAPQSKKTPYFMNTNNNSNNFSVNPSVQMGVMYISNDRTFSISGSVSVSHNNYYNYGYSPFIY